jgi:hypothetical protein
MHRPAVTQPNSFADNGHHEEIVPALAPWPDAGPENLQMKRLKFLELTLVAASPPIHHWVRRAYNRIGPRLASIFPPSAWSADAAFLAMKPFEWLANIVQRLADIRECRITAIYASNEPAELRWSIGYCSDRKR